MVGPMTIVLWVSTVVVTMFSVLGCVGNIIAVRVWSNGQLCKAIPFAGYFRYLAIADLLTIVLSVYPLFISYAFNATLAATSDFLCPIMEFLMRFVVCVSLWIMVALLVDRSGCHMCPCSTDGAKRRSHIVCAIVVISMGLAFVPQLTFSKLIYIDHMAGYVEPQYDNDQLLTTTTQRYHWHINSNVDSFNMSLDYPTNSPDYSSPNDQPIQTACISDIPGWIRLVQDNIVQLYTPPALASLCAIILAKGLICSRRSRSASKQLDPDHRVTLLVCVLGWLFSATRGLNMIPYTTFNSQVGYAIYFMFLAPLLINSSNVVNSLLYFMLPDYRHDVRLMFKQAPAQHQHEDRINNQELVAITDGLTEIK